MDHVTDADQWCQAPDAYVTLCLVLSEMWAGERLGNFNAHHDRAIR